MQVWITIFFLVLTVHRAKGYWCQRSCYNWCPADYCFLSGNSTNPGAQVFADLTVANQYCQSLGCYLPAFMNFNEYSDYVAYRNCPNNTMWIGAGSGYYAWLDYKSLLGTNTVASQGSWFVATPTNPRFGSTYLPTFDTTEPSGTGSEYFTALSPYGKLHDIPQLPAASVIAICMCVVCPNTMCGLTGGKIAVSGGNSQFYYAVGSRVDFSCDYGYHLVGPTSSICAASIPTYTANWTNEKPVCNLVFCDDIFDVNATSGYSNNNVFAAFIGTYTFNCYPDFVHLAQNSTTPVYNCTQTNPNATSGVWVPQNFTECTITCSNLPDPYNGTVVYPYSPNPLNQPPLGTNATYTCNLGYNLIGPSLLTCMDNGNWSLDPPICQPNCSLSAWTDWSQCSQTCGNGSQIRTRNITQPGLCFPLTEVQSCGQNDCIIQIVIVYIQNIGCSVLLALIAATFLLNLILGVRHLERLIHACEEATLFIAHIFILAFRNSVDNTLICTITASVIQFCMLSCFTFFVLEAVQAYAYVTSVTARGNFLPAWLNLIFGFVITGPLVYLYHSEYPSKFSCWLNWGSKIAFGSAIPIMAFSGVVVIILEAAGMGLIVPLVNRDNVKYSANWFNRKGLFMVMTSCIVHWYIGFTAIYYGNVALYTAVFITFTVLGVMIFIHHSLCHHVVHVWLYKQYRKFCCKKGPMPSWVVNPNSEKHKKGLEGINKFFNVTRKPQWQIDAERALITTGHSIPEQAVEEITTDNSSTNEPIPSVKNIDCPKRPKFGNYYTQPLKRVAPVYDESWVSGSELLSIGTAAAKKQ